MGIYKYLLDKRISGNRNLAPCSIEHGLVAEVKVQPKFIYDVVYFEFEDLNEREPISKQCCTFIWCFPWFYIDFCRLPGGTEIKWKMSGNS